MYELRYKKSVEKELRSLPQNILLNTVDKIQKLSKNPRPSGCVKLRGSDNLYRIRCSDYRIVYSIDDNILTILVIKISHRKDVYRDF